MEPFILIDFLDSAYSVSDGELFEYVVQEKSLSERATRFLFLQLFSAIRVGTCMDPKGIFSKELV